MAKHIETKEGLKKLLHRYKIEKADQEELKIVEGCIKEGLAMDETDYENTPDELKHCWNGLR